MSQQAITEPCHPHLWKPCVLLIGNRFFGGKSLGLPSLITTRLQVHRENDRTSWLGFTIKVPFGANSEDNGFGKCHEWNRTLLSNRPKEDYKVTIEFPADSPYLIQQVEQSLLASFPYTEKVMCRLDVYLKEGTYVTVKGFGIPFYHLDHPSDGWINHNEPIVGDMTLVDIIEQRKFSFVVASGDRVLEKYWSQELPGPFRYPYGEDHSWSLERYNEQLFTHRGPQFVAALTFDNDNEHLAAMTQSQVQDIMWLYKEVQQVAETRLRAYFVKVEDNSLVNEFYAVVPLKDNFIQRFREIWPQLIKDEFLQIKLFDSDDNGDEKPASWDAKIMEYPRGLAIMARHQIRDNDLILRVRRPRPFDSQRRPDFEVHVFNSRATANAALREDHNRWNSVSLKFDDQIKECKRKVDAVCMFHPQAQPSTAEAPQDVRFKMALHRALLRGNGFYHLLVRDESCEINHAPRSLPVVNYLDIDDGFITTLLLEVLPEDRTRFYNYMAKRPLGLGCISAGPGFGKTTAISVATIGMAATLGKIYALAPTHVATDTFADRLNRITQRVTDRYNKCNLIRRRRALVVRGYKFRDEYDAFIGLLRNPRSGSTTATKWRADSN
ncbi:hypothetical protein N5P37_010932 [Trichoderma harzianum]|nr:hypothetical protein N5P37_010932 [Trichoderma harzianum]